MTVVWWSLRLYCPSLVAWIYIYIYLYILAGFLGKVFCILIFGSKQNKELPGNTYIHTLYHFSRIFMAGFQWNHFSSQRKKIFYLNFSEIRRIVSTWRANTHSTQAHSFLDDLSVFAHHHHHSYHHHKLPSRPFFTRPPSTTYTGIIWPTSKTSAPILSPYLALRPLWRSREIDGILSYMCCGSSIKFFIISNRFIIAHLHKHFFVLFNRYSKRRPFPRSLVWNTIRVLHTKFGLPLSYAYTSQNTIPTQVIPCDVDFYLTWPLWTVSKESSLYSSALYPTTLVLSSKYGFA